MSRFLTIDYSFSLTPFPLSLGLSPVNGREMQIGNRSSVVTKNGDVHLSPIPFTGEGGRQAGRGEAVSRKTESSIIDAVPNIFRRNTRTPPWK
jgi:hypothetical protein